MKPSNMYSGVSQNNSPRDLRVGGRPSYKAQISRAGRPWYLGTYVSPEAAAYAFDHASRRLDPWTDRSYKLNFPGEAEPASKLNAVEFRSLSEYLETALEYLRTTYPGREEAAKLGRASASLEEGLNLLLRGLDESASQIVNTAKVVSALRFRVEAEVRRHSDAAKEAKVLSDFYKAQVSERDAKIEALESKLDLKEHAASIPEVLTFKPIKKALPTSASFES